MTISHLRAMYQKPTVLQVLPELQSGGVERGTIEVSQALMDNGFRSLVASSGGRMVSQLYHHDARHILLPLQSKNPFVIRQNAKKLAQIIKDENVNIIHARSRAPAWSAYMAAKATGTTFMTTYHGAYSRGSLFKHWYNGVMTKGKRVVAVSEFIAEHILKHYSIDPSRLAVIPRGVDTEAFCASAISSQRIMRLAKLWQLPEDRPVILLPGRITRWKGQHFLIEALKRLSAGSYYCVIAGSAAGHIGYRDELLHEIANAGLKDHIKVVDAIQDMPAAYLLADIVVSASIEPEAFGRVAAEAQAMGRLVIATNHGGACETVLHDRTGWLVEPGNVEDLSYIIQNALLLSDDQRRMFACDAVEHIHQNFSLSKMQNRLMQVYHAVLEDPVLLPNGSVEQAA